MTITADRMSDTEVKVGETIYIFEAKAQADAFTLCLANDSLETCATNHAVVSTRAASPDATRPDAEPGSIISPSMGGMP
ncbi:hypothetical protein BHUM_03741 [Candidatus Burkholderia humilis]|nr:hypothetical protein BHUM_03741 [Candidatus Burkholderia humilis]